jgi:hypothetical protein
MPDEVRPASTPTTGMLRDAIRTFVAFLVAFLFTWLGGKIPGIDLVGMQEGVIVIITSAILAFMGKAFRNNDVTVGRVI